MPVVRVYVKDAENNPIDGAPVTVRLMSSAKNPGFMDGGDAISVEVTDYAASDGLVEFTLPSNAIITPSGTYYRFEVSKSRSSTRVAKVFNVSVPNGAGPYDVEDILVDAPPAPTPTYLTAQQLEDHRDTVGDHDDVDLTGAATGRGLAFNASGVLVPTDMGTQIELDAERDARIAADTAEALARTEADADEATAREDADDALAIVDADDRLVSAKDLNALYDTIDRLYGGYSLDTTFVDLGVPTAVAAQTTAFGKRIHGLRDFDGRMFIEYGDWNANTGPIKLLCWDPATSTFVEEHELATEQVRYRVIGTSLWALCMDPRGSNPPSYARRSAGSTTWTEVALPVEPVHVLDVAELNGVLYLATQTDDPGSASFDATIWASSDNGATWTDIKRFASINTPPNTSGIARAWMLLVRGGFLYVEPYHDGLRPEPGTRGVAERFNGTTWDEAPSMLSPTHDVGWDGTTGPIGHKAAPFTAGPNLGWVPYLGHMRSRLRVTTLNAYNGEERITLRRGVRDFVMHPNGQTLYVLDALGRMEVQQASTTASVRDITWQAARSGPTVSVENAYSLGLIGGFTAYVGTIEGHIWRGSAV